LLLGTTVVLLISAVLIAHKLHLITRHFPFIVTNAPESQAISPPPARGSLAQPQVDPVHLLLQQAFQLLEQKQFDAALDKVNVALQAAPKNEDAYGLRGNIYAEKKLWDQAEKDYQTGLQIDGKNVQIKFNLAEIQFMQKKYDDARPGFAALEQNSNMGDLATYKVFLCDLFGGHEDVSAKELDELDAFNQVGRNASYYFGNAAWSLYHQKTEDARSWLTSAANIYAPNKFRLYAASLIDLGYMPLPPPPQK
jgi:tetratricopeptide (TPR) repeat protein